mgnify:CR=1 FL=1
MKKTLIPLALFIVLAVFLGIGLTRDPHEIPSPLINKPAPDFKLPYLDDPAKTFSPAEYRDKVWLLNVWGSWCSSCTIAGTSIKPRRVWLPTSRNAPDSGTFSASSVPVATPPTVTATGPDASTTVPVTETLVEVR